MSADDPAAVARLLSVVAADLERRGYSAVGAVRLGARLLATLAPVADDACPVCGGAVQQPATGRTRTYCSPRCKNRARRPTSREC